MDNALRWPVRGRYLSTGQRATLTLCHSLAARRRRFTLAELAAWSGTSSRGRAHDRLARLRSLGLIGFRADRGRNGRIRVWIRPELRHGVSSAAYRGRPAVNDSLSPYGGFLTPTRAAAEWSASRSRRRPPGSPGPSGLTGPRRGRRPPRVLWAKCPAGHTVTTGRRSWTERIRPPSLHAVYLGRCRRCSAEVRESLELVVTLEPRALSPAELADPALLARRQAAAAAIVADSGLSLAVRASLERDYLAPPGSREPADHGPRRIGPLMLGFESRGPAARGAGGTLGLHGGLDGQASGGRGRDEGAAGDDHRRPAGIGGDAGQDPRGEQGPIRGPVARTETGAAGADRQGAPGDG